MSLYITPHQEATQLPQTLYVPSADYVPTGSILPSLSDNEIRLVAIGVIGIVGWILFKDKIKAKLR